MVTGPKDAGQTPSHDPKRDTPHRPDAVQPSTAWPESPNMVSQNAAAQRTFERNSERLQQAQEAKREPQSQEQSATQSKDLSFVKDRSRYNELKKENAVATGRDTAADQSQQQGIGSKDLSFAKDRDPGNYNDLKKEQSVATGKDAADGRGEQPASGERAGGDRLYRQSLLRSCVGYIICAGQKTFLALEHHRQFAVFAVHQTSRTAGHGFSRTPQ